MGFYTKIENVLWVIDMKLNQCLPFLKCFGIIFYCQKKKARVAYKISTTYLLEQRTSALLGLAVNSLLTETEWSGAEIAAYIHPNEKSTDEDGLTHDPVS